MLHYKIPREPTALRVSVWRRLKRLGAILLHDAVWVLPATPETRENCQWLSTDIREQGSEAMIWEAHLLLPGQDDVLVHEFLAQVESEYDAIMKALSHGDPDLGVLGRRYQQTCSHDYFHSPRGQQVRQALTDIAGGLDG